MSLVTDLWNQALGRIGQLESITDENATGSSARWCRHYYAAARDTTLEAFDWPFARRVFWAPTLANTPPPPWGYCLQMPPSCLAIRGYHQGDIATAGTIASGALPAFTVSTASGLRRREAEWADWMDYLPDEPFEVAGETSANGADADYVLTMAEGGFFRFTRKVTDAARFKPLFTDALIWKLAADLAMSKAGWSEMRNSALQMYQRALDAAAVAAARQKRIRTSWPNQGDPLVAYR
jgi:hypothetical protein